MTLFEEAFTAPRQILPRDGEAVYFQTAFSNEQSARYLRTLTDETPWEARNIILFGK